MPRSGDANSHNNCGDYSDELGCNANPYPGPERIFSFEPGLGGLVTITLDGETGGLDLMFGPALRPPR
jgi:hypothetical protein